MFIIYLFLCSYDFKSADFIFLFFVAFLVLFQSLLIQSLDVFRQVIVEYNFVPKLSYRSFEYIKNFAFHSHTHTTQTYPHTPPCMHAHVI